MRRALPHIARSSTAITRSQHTLNVPGAELTRSKVCPCKIPSHLAKDSNHPKLLCVQPSISGSTQSPCRTFWLKPH